MALANNHTNDTDDIVHRSGLVFGVAGLLQLPVILFILLLMIFVYKTYRTTLQRLILYYVIIGLWFEFSYGAVQILRVFTDERWVCIIIQFLIFSSMIAYHVYLVAITNFSLLLIPCLMRGRPVSKRIGKYVECICVALTAIIALTAASVMQIEDHFAGCTNPKPRILVVEIRGVIIMSNFLGVDLEVVLVSLSLCFAFCFIRRRIRNRQTAVLLRNSICHVGINAIVMIVMSIGTGYDIYMWSKHKLYDSRDFLDTTGVLIYNVLLMLIVGVSVIIQALTFLCIQTSTQGSCCKTCYRVSQHQQYHNHYAVIHGKDAATNPASRRVSQPSHTTFAVPYTGGFTQITESINNNEENEQRRLIECVN